ncbi:MAG: hypothetical protein JNK02_10445 [Planctomycetes bacterium]|nr:hypothetical protein [Planctomycetota bacterium]
MALINGAQPPENYWGDLSYEWATSEQKFTLRYYPTACCVIDNESIVVAGKADDGQTIIELWTLAWPSPMPAPIVNTQTGVSSVNVALPSIAARTELYKANIVGRVLARNMCGLRRASGSTENLLVQFDDSSDLLSLNLSTKVLTFVAGSTASGGVLGILPLSADQDYLQFGDRITGAETGYSYTFGVSRGGSCMLVEDPNFASLILLDSNRDGVIDGTRQYTNAQRSAGGWTNLVNFANYWKP